MKREKSIFHLDGKAMTIEINDYGFSQNSAENFQSKVFLKLVR